MGFAVLMFGMSAMSGAVAPLKESAAFTGLLTSFSNPFLGILVGIIFTSVLQSASAAVGILQALAITGALTFEVAFPIIMGVAIGAFCQSSCYVPINKIKDWSWESYWVVQGVFAWLILPFLGAMLAVPSGHSFFELFDGYGFNVAMTMLFGVLWGVGGLTFGLLPARAALW